MKNILLIVISSLISLTSLFGEERGGETFKLKGKWIVRDGRLIVAVANNHLFDVLVTHPRRSYPLFRVLGKIGDNPPIKLEDGFSPPMTLSGWALEANSDLSAESEMLWLEPSNEKQNKIARWSYSLSREDEEFLKQNSDGKFVQNLSGYTAHVMPNDKHELSKAVFALELTKLTLPANVHANGDTDKKMNPRDNQ